MPRYVLLLRGINLVKHNRVSMPELRSALSAAGFEDVATYVQSGNIVLSSSATPETVVASVQRIIVQRFGFEPAIIVRTHRELFDVLRRNPLRDVATDPRGYLVTFLSGEPPSGFADDLHSAAGQQPFAVVGREIYSWHPRHMGRSPLWERLAGGRLGVVGTSRNWLTVTRLAELSAES